MSTKKDDNAASKITNYDSDVYADLQDDEFMLAYVNDALQDEYPEAFLLALREVVTARGGFEKVAENANIGRTALYNMLSKTGNPRYDSLRALMGALGLKMKLDAA